MRAPTNCSKTIKGGNAECRGEIPIGSAAGGSFLQGESEVCRNLLCNLKKPHRIRSSFHRGTVNRSPNFQAGIRKFRRECSDDCCDPLRFFVGRDPDVNFSGGLGWNHVGSGAAFYNADTDGGAASEIIQTLKSDNLPGNFFDCVYATLGVNSGRSEEHTSELQSHSF